MEGEVTFEEDDLAFNKLKLATDEMFAQMVWFCEMYKNLGEADAQGLKIIKDENTGKNWTKGDLHRERNRFIKNSKIVTLNNYKLFAKQSKKKQKRAPPKQIQYNEDGTKKDNLNPPFIMSKQIIDFFNQVDLGTVEVEGKKVRFQDTIACLRDKDRITTPTIISNLFDVWIIYTNLKDEQGKVIRKGLQNPVLKGTVYANDDFKKFFKADLDKIIEEKKQSRIPIQNSTVEIDGKICKPAYELPYPTFFKVLIAKHKEVKVEESKAALLRPTHTEDNNKIHDYKHLLRGV